MNQLKIHKVPSVHQIVRQRNKRELDLRKSLAHMTGLVTVVLIALTSLIGAVLLILATSSYASLIHNLPSTDEIVRLLDPSKGLLTQPTMLLDRSGENVIFKLENPAAIDRQYLPIDSIQEIHLSETIVKATIATVDPSFWTNQGYSWDGILNNEHPTIAQRLVNDLLLWNEPVGLQRALKERILAAQITEKYGRDQVLEWYLNSADYGHLAYGIDAAAWIYFGKSAVDLTLAEAAVLAATAETPGWNPHSTPELVPEYQNKTLHAMLAQGYISADEFKQANLEKIKIHDPIQSDSRMVSAYADLTLNQLSSKIDIERLKRGGLSVITTLDYNLQFQTWCASEIHLARITGKTEIPDDLSDLNECKAGLLLPSTPQVDLTMSSAKIGSNIVVIDPSNGEILVMVGESEPELNPASPPGHPAGTLMTPIIYLTAFSRGYSPASLVWDIPTDSSTPNGNTSKIEEVFHGPVRLRTAMVNDYLSPAVQLLAEMGSENVWRFAQQLGIESFNFAVSENDQPNPLDFGQVTLLEVTQAYSVIANKGTAAGQVISSNVTNGDSLSIQPITVRKVSDSLGNTWLDCQYELKNCQPYTKPIISPQLAYLLTNILSDETSRWSSLGHPNPLEIGRPAGAKIGQTFNHNDSWTVGYTPERVVGVWIGTSNFNPDLELPALSAATLWHAIIQYATQDMPLTDWSIPPGISSIDVCDPSGMLPTEYCPNVVTEVFQHGREPTQKDTLFRSFQINRETERLATVFTPPELVETRVYMDVPTQASTWATQSGIPLPPDSYDVLDSFDSFDETTNITSPEFFAHVGGQVTIIGNASGENFEYYRVQVGKGLNPTSWLQVGPDVNKPVTDGELALWDTTDQEGLFALQLLVVNQENNVKTYTTQVTIDNQSPELTIQYPTEGQQFTYPADSTIPLHATITDDLELTEVKFFIDDAIVSSLSAPPFIVPWQVRLGEHTLRIQAVDMAGNLTEKTVVFNVTR